MSGLSVQLPLAAAPNALANGPAEGLTSRGQSFEVWLNSPCSDARAVYDYAGPSLCGRVIAAPVAGVAFIVSNVVCRAPIVTIQGIWECSKCLADTTRSRGYLFVPGL